jgi:hypothetical protein
MTYRDVPITTEKCPGCFTEVPRGTDVCPSCRAPIDISRFAELELKLKPDLRKARRFLGLVTALDAFWLFVAVAEGMGRSAIVARGFSVAFFGICFLVAFRRPLGASIAAMAMFLFGEAAAIGMGRLAILFEGIVLKVVLVTLLASAIRSGYRIRELRRQWRKRDRNIGIAILVGSVVLGVALGVAGARP